MLTPKSSTAVCPSLPCPIVNTQSKNLEFVYRWCEDGLQTHNLSATANIYSGLSGFLWLLSLSSAWPMDFYPFWRQYIPLQFDHQIASSWGSQLVRSYPVRIKIPALIFCGIYFQGLFISWRNWPPSGNSAVLLSRPRRSNVDKIKTAKSLLPSMHILVVLLLMRVVFFYSDILLSNFTR